MIGAHPGGVELTKRLLALSGVKPPANVLDLGAGNGESLRYLQSIGYQGVGIDLVSKMDTRIFAGDMTMLPFADESMDICLAECSVSVCGNGPAALQEAYRVLGRGGNLLLSDVYFQKESAPHLSMPGPMTRTLWEREIRKAGFAVLAFQDETALWRAFFLESLWNDNADVTCCDFFRTAGKAGCGYFLAHLKKGEQDGLI